MGGKILAYLLLQAIRMVKHHYIWRVKVWQIAINLPNSPIFSPSKYFLCTVSLLWVQKAQISDFLLRKVLVKLKRSKLHKNKPNQNTKWAWWFDNCLTRRALTTGWHVSGFLILLLCRCLCVCIVHPQGY